MAFKFTCLYLFFEYVRPQSTWPAIDVLPYAQLTILAAFFAMLLEASRAGWTRSPANVLLAIFSFTVIVSIPFAYSPRVSLGYWDQYLPWLVIYAVITNTVTTRARFLLFLIVFLLASFKMSQHGFRSWVDSGLAGRSWGVRGGQGWFQNAGELGIQMNIFMAMSVWFAVAFWKGTGRLARAWLVIMPVTAAATILATNSRGSVLGGVAVLAWIVWRSPYRTRAFVGAGIVAILAVLLIPDLLVERFQSAGEDQTSQSRLTYWRHGMAMLQENPVTGIGYFNWLTYYPLRFPSGYEGFLFELPHNIFVQAGAELGYPGLISYLLLIGCTFAVNAKTRRHAEAQNDRVSWCLATGIDASIVGYVVNGQFVTVLYYPFFWIALAFTVALHRVVTSKAPGGQGNRQRARGRDGEAAHRKRLVRSR